MKKAKQFILFQCVLSSLFLCSIAVTVNAATISIWGNNNNASITNFLNANGHTATDFGFSAPTAAQLSGSDVAIGLPANGNSAVENFVTNGGLLITEWSASAWALNTANLLDATDSSGVPVATGTDITFTSDGITSGLNNGLTNPFSDSIRTEFFRNFTGIGAGVDILATRPGDIPAILGGASGLGSTLIIGYDWADTFNSSSDSATLLLNAINYSSSAPGLNPIPEPTTMVLFGIGLLGLAGVSRKK